MDLKPNLLTEYYFDNNILYTLSSKFYDSIDESLNNIFSVYKGYKIYMTHTDGDNYYVVKFTNNDKLFYIIQLSQFYI